MCLTRNPFISASTTEYPRPAASRAMPQPLMPPPITKISRITSPFKVPLPFRIAQICAVAKASGIKTSTFRMSNECGRKRHFPIQWGEAVSTRRTSCSWQMLRMPSEGQLSVMEAGPARGWPMRTSALSFRISSRSETRMTWRAFAMIACATASPRDSRNRAAHRLRRSRKHPMTA